MSVTGTSLLSNKFGIYCRAVASNEAALFYSIRHCFSKCSSLKMDMSCTFLLLKLA